MYNNNKRQKRKPIYDAELGLPPTDKQVERMVRQSKNVINFWLGKADQPRKKMFDKLVTGKKITVEIANQVLDEYEALGYIDDRKYAENFVDSKLRYEKLGVFSIKQKLALKGIDREIIDSVVEDIDEEQVEENAYDLARKRLNPTRKLEPQKRLQNIAAFLARRGYNGGVAFKVAKEVLAEDAEDIADDNYDEIP